MRFAAPEWFLVAPIFLYIGWRYRSLKLWEPLRVLSLLLVLLLLVQPEFRKLSSGLDLWVLVDRSASAEAETAPRAEEVRTLLTQSKGQNDRLLMVEFANDVVLKAEASSELGTDRDATRTGLAVEFALSQMVNNRAARILLFTDGYSTEPLTGLQERLTRQKVPLDYRLAGADRTQDWAVTDFQSAARVRRGEPIVLQAKVVGPAKGGKVPYDVIRDDKKIFSGETQFENGTALIRLTDRLTLPGAHRYTVELRPPNTDSVRGNNRAGLWVEVTGGERFLLVTRYAGDPLGKALRDQGYEVDEVTTYNGLSAAKLSGAKAVILHNVPANLLPADFLGAIDFFVRSQGGGFLMVGGKYSFGSGGYFESKIDDLLPVSMELRQEHRKLAVAMAIVMDRSGSMAATAAGGVTKMDLANEGAARGVELLGDQDSVAVFAVDSLAHEIVPLSRVGQGRRPLVSAIRRVRSTGGGIFVYTGMKAAWKELKKAEVGQRHMVLFADAADAEEEGEYKELLAEMVKEGATVSVIGLGTPADIDAAFLEDIAKRGNGRIFFNADPSQLPALFAQETVAIARSAFLDEPVGLQALPAWNELAAKQLQWPKQVDGYNLSYLREKAVAAAISTDEYAAPLLAFWQRESGRVAAVSFPMAGEQAPLVLAWPAYNDFAQTLGRWLSGPPTPPGVGLRTRLDGARLQVDLFYDPSAEIAKSVPQLVTVEGLGEPKSVAWERQAPGNYRATFDLKGGSPLRGVVEMGGATFPFGPISPATTPEWTFRPERLQELRTLSAASGGVERSDLTKIWEAPRRAEFEGIHLWLAGLLLGILLVETLFTRTGWKLPAIPVQLPKISLDQVRTPKQVVVEASKPEPKPQGEVKPEAQERESAEQKRRSRFERARRGEG